MEKSEIRKALLGLAAVLAFFTVVSILVSGGNASILLGVVTIFILIAALTVDMWTTNRPADPEEQERMLPRR